MKEPFQKGDRIKLLSMDTDEPDPVPVGTTGEVLFCQEMGGGQFHVCVRWDVPRSLNLIWPIDKAEKINE